MKNVMMLICCLLVMIIGILAFNILEEDNYELTAAGDGTAFLWNTKTGDVWIMSVMGKDNWRRKLEKYRVRDEKTCAETNANPDPNIVSVDDFLNNIGLDCE